jgi:alpha-L-fucosidase
MRILFALMIILSCSSANAQEALADLNTKPGNRAAPLEWLQDAGFGMFIHWSLDSQVGSVISHSLVGASDEYTQWFINELPKTFHPKRWDPDEIAALARLCGMRYVVLTAKHHSGFCLWDTKTTDFKINNTPYAKDMLPEYVEALRRHGLKVGLYYSPEDFAWLYRNGHEVRRRGDTLLDPDKHEPYGKFVRDQVTELFTDYGKIDVLFIDGVGAEITKQVCWTLQPDCLITRGAIETPEQFVPGRPPEGAWESNMTMGTQWQYKPTNDNYKSGTRIIEILIETRAKGGALMMNVGPKPNGELPIEQEARLREVALWHAVNGEAIHDTRPWVVAREEDIWFTRSKDRSALYVFLTRAGDWDRGARKEFVLQSVKATDKTSIGVLGHAGRFSEYAPQLDVTPRFQQTDSGLVISVCRAQRLYNNHKWHNPVVVKLQNVEPTFDVPPYAATGTAAAEPGGKIVLRGELLEMAGADQVDVGFEYQQYGGFAEAMYNTRWSRSKLTTMTRKGQFSAVVDGLKPGQQYQYRAMVKHPVITMRGDHRRVQAK